jgi:hypothetical protein
LWYNEGGFFEVQRVLTTLFVPKLEFEDS